jgi:hypothetical protein
MMAKPFNGLILNPLSIGSISGEGEAVGTLAIGKRINR